MIISIKQQILEGRDRKIYCVESESHSVVMLRVCLWEAKTWLLPWSRFENSCFVSGEEFEQMELSFSGLKVIIAGHSLRGLEKDVSTMRVCCLRDLPESHYLTFDPKEPFIKKLEVRLPDGAKNSGQGNLPF
jgi:hypothetical protein